jgi:hypothetical protein
MRWAEYAASKWEVGNAYTILAGRPWRRWRIILRLILSRYYECVNWIHLAKVRDL